MISIIALATAGLKPGIEFSSGSILTVAFEQPVEYDDFTAEIASLGHPNAIVQETGSGDFLIRTQELSDEEWRPSRPAC